MGLNPAAHASIFKNNLAAFNSPLSFMSELELSKLKPELLAREMNNMLMQQASAGKANVDFPLFHTGDFKKSNNSLPNHLNSLNNSKASLVPPSSSGSTSASANQSFLRDFELSLSKQNLAAFNQNLLVSISLLI